MLGESGRAFHPRLRGCFDRHVRWPASVHSTGALHQGLLVARRGCGIPKDESHCVFRFVQQNKSVFTTIIIIIPVYTGSLPCNVL